MDPLVQPIQPAGNAALARISKLLALIYNYIRRLVRSKKAKPVAMASSTPAPTAAPTIAPASTSTPPAAPVKARIIDEQTARLKYWVEEPPINDHPSAEALIKYFRPDIKDRDAMIRVLKDIRLKAWQIKYYPCVGQWLFFKFGMTEHSTYPEIVDRLKQGQRILDMGCFMGFDGRKLVADGAPSSGITNMDLEDRWFPLSFDLFRDENTFEGEFFGGCDITDEDLFGEDSIHRGRYDMIYIGYFIHLFPPSQQPKILNNLVQMLKPKTGSMIFGNTSGTAKPSGYLMKADFAAPTKNERGEWVRPDFLFHSTKTIVDLMATSVKGDGEWDFVGEQSAINLDLSPTKAYAEHFKDVELVNMNFCMRRM
ncbi:Methyltransferase adrK [Drechslerella dactyloides]|uniref:Methyltransferase adrK n=1 Tax=Drechslerella dactyloides TaxID=74499 RepID=A0AAD6J1S5_DREDA|nr:Methyltransferase adrK [Drechslerella dactyloides]